MSDLDRLFSAWCSQHDCHPVECWEKHVVRSKIRHVESQKELEERIKTEHITLQQKLVRCIKCQRFTNQLASHKCKESDANT